jgi:hypothetical protein
MEAAASVGATSAKAGLSSEGVASSYPAVVESSEGAGMHSLMTSKATGVNVRAMIEVVHSSRTKIIAVDDRPAMRDERVVVVDDSPAAVPIVSPTVPTPAEAGK